MYCQKTCRAAKDLSVIIAAAGLPNSRSDCLLAPEVCTDLSEAAVLGLSSQASDWCNAHAHATLTQPAPSTCTLY